MISEEEKQKAISECLKLLGRANKHLNNAHKQHLIKNGNAANDETRNDKGA